MVASLPASVRPQVLLHEWMRLVLGVLHQLGLEHAVISPGSRNAPLIHGALRQAGLTCHSVLDERAAGFFALGLARASRKPVALICTSGSAVAHYFPAVIEAHHSGVPLMVLSADRPSRLQSCGAAQTIDQTSIFGAFARTLAGWDEASAAPQALRHFARKVAQLHQLSRGPLPGPVHLNVPLDKPLEPQPPTTPVELELQGSVHQVLAALPTLPVAPMGPHGADLQALLSTFAQTPGGKFISVGPVEPSIAVRAGALGLHLGLPVVSEIPALAGPWTPDFLAQAWLRAAPTTPLQALHIGPPLISSHWAQLIAQGLVQQWVLPGVTYLEPSAQAASVLLGDLARALEGLRKLAAPALNSAQAAFPPPAPLEQALIRADDACGAACMSEPRAVLGVLQAVQPHHQLLLANSLSLRLAAWVQRPGLCSAPAYTSRGANGIDGWIAQASGVSQATSAPTLVLLGDVAAAHDLSALALARQCKTPLVVCVIDNEGGRIFEHLPGAQLWPEHPRSAEFFLTPPRVEWTAAARAYSVAATLCRTSGELQHALQAALAHPGPTLVVVRTDPQSTRAFLRCFAEASP
jgi:2-succinyl-5-enolpyruvyl-6-hydroxy-3-cyclohexene-1-carboxylate synthase